jgi:hypothetical protein
MPVDILMWLYDMALYQEEVKLADAYSVGPEKSGKAGKTNAKNNKKNKKNQEVEEDEDTSFGMSYKDLQKKKPPARPPQMPSAGGKQLTEKEKEE